MEMSETFAATVAGVAPVIWLVGALEMHQYAKRRADESRALEKLYAEGRAAAEGGDPGTVREAIRLMQERVEPVLASAESNMTLRKAVYSLWAVVVAALLAAESGSLMWLATGGGTESGLAWLCLVALVAGFAAVTSLPVIVTYVEMEQAIKRRREHAGNIAALLAAERRSQAGPSEPPAGA
ncbi:hypothetical protein OG912_16825 [Streptomyces sp. NBC_00464]|uniref:hypothetical protein n=1 Tax=Streptomyces sp. NBC_00464 TaxID=2975751 RepID=UPI002E17C62B